MRLFIGYTMRNMPCGHYVTGITAIGFLIIEKDVCAISQEKLRFIHPAQKQAFIYSDLPGSECFYYSFVAWC